MLDNYKKTGGKRGEVMAMKLKDYLKFEDSYKQLDYPKDIERIVKVMKDRNIEITPDEADELRNMYSDDLCAQ